MEFPELGKHCGFKECNLLDFLPVKCGWCRGHFCKDHWAFEAHHCPDAQQQNRGSQVPVCPLCDGPVPTPKGRSADEFVSAHIDRDCKADEDLKRRQRVFTKRCSVPKCRQKLVVKVDCSSCRRTFCLTHRHPQDHSCKPDSNPGRPQPSSAARNAAMAASSRAAAAKTSSTSAFGSSYGNPAAAAAIQAPTTMEEQDMMLAIALSESLKDHKPTAAAAAANPTPSRSALQPSTTTAASQGANSKPCNIS